MAISITIKRNRTTRDRYLYRVGQRKMPTDETDALVKRVAVEVARFFAGQMAEDEKPKST